MMIKELLADYVSHLFYGVGAIMFVTIVVYLFTFVSKAKR
jgi:hypothetical protein